MHKNISRTGTIILVVSMLIVYITVNKQARFLIPVKLFLCWWMNIINLKIINKEIKAGDKGKLEFVYLFI